MWRSPMILALAACLICLGLGPAIAADAETSGELRLHWDARSSNPAGPLADADTLAPGIAAATRSAALAEAELRGHWHPVSANLLLWSERPEGGTTQSHARVNELYASGDFRAWQASAGKKIVGWDVGYGFRPNDFVQQEQRRTLLTVTPEGRPLLQLEHFNAETASSLVWVNPQRSHDADDDQRNAGESALAARWYRRAGAADWHLFGRWGEHSGASLGAALAWVATDELELHASLRALQRHDGWRVAGTTGNAPLSANPWRVDTLGGAAQVLLGANWTGAQQQSILVEWWHDGTALSDAEWDRWRARNRALTALGAQPGLPAGLVTGIAGNLAWQASPFNASNLRRDNLFVRLAWQPEHWLFSLDALLTPADRGRSVTAAVQWQGDRLRINAAWRVYGGAADAVLAQLPQWRSGVVAATWAF